MEYIGLAEATYQEKKLTLKPTPVDKKSLFEINHHASQHTMDLQRSPYLVINSNINMGHVLTKNILK